MIDSKTAIKKPQTLREAIKYSTQFLINENITNARNEVIWFLEDHLGIKKKTIF